MTVVVLAGGTGGAKLARGMLDVVGDELAVVVNTGDDVEIHGAYVSPDPDLVTFWLGDVIDARGWGIEGDTFEVMGALRDLGEDVWFNLGDRDLALGLWRAERLRAGHRLTTIAADAARSYAVTAQVLPMCDEPVRTWVDGTPFQEWMIRAGGRAGGEVGSVEFRGAEAASATPEVVAAIREARAVIVGPSNPVISVGPILAVPGIREALTETEAPVVAVSPLVGGTAVKGPTEAFMAHAGHPLSSDGIAAIYDGLIDGLVADEAATELPTAVTDVMMADAAGRARLAREALEFALML
jgi:LPPG:FO 2-phospho-L-lactate transferase